VEIGILANFSVFAYGKYGALFEVDAQVKFFRYNFVRNFSRCEYFTLTTRSSAYNLCQKVNSLHFTVTCSIASSMYISKSAELIGDP
jgi:hypothetical protein